MTVQEAELMIGEEVEVMTLDEICKIGFVSKYNEERIHEKEDENSGFFIIDLDSPVAGKRGILRRLSGGFGSDYLRINSPQKNGVTEWEIPPSFVKLPTDYNDLNEIEE